MPRRRTRPPPPSSQGVGPYKKTLQAVEKDIKSLNGKINDLIGIKESDTGLAPPSQWDLVSDKQMMQEEQPLQVDLIHRVCLCLQHFLLHALLLLVVIVVIVVVLLLIIVVVVVVGVIDTKRFRAPALPRECPFRPSPARRPPRVVIG